MDDSLHSCGSEVLSSAPGNRVNTARRVDEGLEAQRLGHHADALAAFEECLDADPAHPVAHLHAGFSNFQLARWEKGVAHTRAAAAASPENAAAWSNLALGLRALGNIDAARDAAQRALALDARLPEAWNVLGLAEQDAQHPELARRHFARALELRPRFPQARLNLANCDQALGSIDAALAGYEEMAALEPRLAEVPYNLAHLHHKATGRFEEAAAYYRKAIVLDPAHAMAHHNLAHVEFLLGHFAEAWAEYRWRPPRLRYETWIAARGRSYSPPSPDALAGKRLIVVGEQGLGDMVFFLRFAPMVRAHGARIDLACDARLHSMLDRTGVFERFASSPRELSIEGAIEVLAGDLPRLLPADEAFGAPPSLALTPHPDRSKALEQRLAALGPPPYVAVAWRAGIARSGIEESLFKELPLDEFGAALRPSRATWVSVQREPRAGETEALSAHAGAPVHDFSSMNEDLEEALALMALCDYSVGVSNTNVHLRAATRPDGHVLVPFPPEWRWMARGTSRWFPGIRVYRQDASRDWSSGLQALERDLAAALGPRA